MIANEGRLARLTIAGLTTLTLLLTADLGGLGAQETQAAPAGPLGLSTLARAALEGNRDLQAARQTYITAQEQVSEAWSNVMPSIDFNASYQRNISPAVNFLPAVIFDPDAGPDEYIPVQFGADNQWSSTISVEQPLFQGDVFVGLGAARRFETLQSEVMRGQSQTVVTQVRIAYYDLLLAQEQSRLIENSVHRVRESLRETKALNTAGLVSDYEVLRLEVELANLEPNLRRAENAILQTRRQLGIVANIPDHESLEVRGSLAEIDLGDIESNSPENLEILYFNGMPIAGPGAIDEVLATGLAQATEMRSDLRQLELTEDLRFSEMRAEQATYLPEVTLFGSYVISAQDNGSPSFFGRGDGQRADSKAIGVRVSLPIFQGFRRDARVDQRRAALRQAEVNTAQGLDVAESQVRTIVDNVEEAYLRATGQQLAVTQAQRGFEIASAQYAEGIGGQLELTDAEVALRQSEFNYAQAIYDYLLARAQLDEAVGQVPIVDVPLGQAGDN